MFMRKELVNLGFVISNEGLKMDFENLKYILEWPTPRCAFDVRIVHGLVRLYRKFIENFNVISAPLT